MAGKTRINFVTTSVKKFEHFTKIVNESAIADRVDLHRVEIDLKEIQGDFMKVVRSKGVDAFITLRDQGFGGITVVEDTGLNFDAWCGELPGPYIKDFITLCGPQQLTAMIPPGFNRGATATSSFCVKPSIFVTEVVTAKVRGRIAENPVVPPMRLANDWDCIFVPEGQDKPMSMMTPEEYYTHLPRRLACEKLIALLADMIAAQ